MKYQCTIKRNGRIHELTLSEFIERTFKGTLESFLYLDEILALRVTKDRYYNGHRIRINGKASGLGPSLASWVYCSSLEEYKQAIVHAVQSAREFSKIWYEKPAPSPAEVEMVLFEDGQ